MALQRDSPLPALQTTWSPPQFCRRPALPLPTCSLAWGRQRMLAAVLPAAPHLLVIGAFLGTCTWTCELVEPEKVPGCCPFFPIQRPSPDLVLLGLLPASSIHLCPGPLPSYKAISSPHNPQGAAQNLATLPLVCSWALPVGH